MIKITTINDLSKIDDTSITPYIKGLLDIIQHGYNISSEQSIEPFGAIFYLEHISDLQLYTEMGLSLPLVESRFEYIEEIGNDYCNGWILINNETVINLIAKKDIFNTIVGDNYEYC